MTLPSFQFVLNNTLITCDLEKELKGCINDDIIRAVPMSLKIEAYPRRDRPTKQQIYINNSYFMTVPSAVYLDDDDLQDPFNDFGDDFIYIIEELYKRGYNLNKIKDILNFIIGFYTDKYCKPHYW